MANLIDLSGRVEEGQPVFGSQGTVIWNVRTFEESGYEKVQRHPEDEDRPASMERHLQVLEEGAAGVHPLNRALLVAEHGPTHVDAMIHLDPFSDESIEKMSLDWFYGPAIGIDVSHLSHEEWISTEEIQAQLDDASLELREGDILTIHTGHRDRNYGLSIEKRWAYLHRYTGLTEEAAIWLGKLGIKNVGMDTPSIDHPKNTSNDEYPAHFACAQYNFINMENMANLDDVAGRRYTICAFPLKIDGGTGSPIRPVAILDD